MRAVRVTIALLTAVALMAVGASTPAPVAQGAAGAETIAATSSIERADSAPLQYIAESGPAGVVFGFDPNPHSTGSQRTTRSTPTPAFAAPLPVRVAVQLRLRLDHAGDLHLAHSGWSFFATTAPPPFRV